MTSNEIDKTTVRTQSGRTLDELNMEAILAGRLKTGDKHVVVAENGEPGESEGDVARAGKGRGLGQRGEFRRHTQRAGQIQQKVGQVGLARPVDLFPVGHVQPVPHGHVV